MNEILDLSQEEQEIQSTFEKLERMLEGGESALQHYTDAEGEIEGGEVFVHFSEEITSEEKEELFTSLHDDSPRNIRLAQAMLKSQCEAVRNNIDEKKGGSYGINLVSQWLENEEGFEYFVGELQNFSPEQLACVRLEISEKAQLSGDALEKMKNLVRHGVRFALDDLGVEHHALTEENVVYLSKIYNELGEGLAQVKFDRALWQRELWHEMWTQADVLHRLVKDKEVVYEWAEDLNESERIKLAKLMLDAGAKSVKFQGAERQVLSVA